MTIPEETTISRASGMVGPFQLLALSADRSITLRKPRRPSLHARHAAYALATASVQMRLKPSPALRTSACVRAVVSVEIDERIRAQVGIGGEEAETDDDEIDLDAPITLDD